MLLDVGDVESFPEAACTIVSINEREIGIVRWRSRFFALLNKCADQSGPVCTGPLRPHLSYDTELDKIIGNDDRPMIKCPYHFWQFDVMTGRSILNNTRLRTFRTSIEGSRLFVEIGPESEPGHDAAAVVIE